MIHRCVVTVQQRSKSKSVHCFHLGRWRELDEILFHEPSIFNFQFEFSFEVSTTRDGTVATIRRVVHDMYTSLG